MTAYSIPIFTLGALLVLTFMALWEGRRRRRLPPRDKESLDWGLLIDEPDSAIGAGWYLELDGKQVAELTEPRHRTGEFWFNYRVTPLTTNPGDLERLYAKDDWDNCRFKFRSRKFGVLAPHAFASQPPSRETGRIWVRGLHIQLDQGPSIVERVASLFKRPKNGSTH